MRKCLLPLIIFCSGIACEPPAVSNAYSEHPLFPLDSAWLANNSSLAANGVYYYDSSKAENGVTLLDQTTRTILIDMQGKVLTKFPFGLTEILPDGGMIGFMDADMVKFDEDFSIIWKKPAEIHHEIEADENENIYVLSTDNHEFMGLSIVFDVLKIYSSDGDLIYKWCVYDHMTEFLSVISKSAYLCNLPDTLDPAKGAAKYISQDPKQFFYPFMSDTSKCVFVFTHLNSIQVLPENEVSKKIPAFKKGNLLLSFNPFSCYGILDTATGKIIWAGYLPERTTLHTPLLTPQGTILIFQNSTRSYGLGWNSSNKHYEQRCLEYLYKRIPPQRPGQDPESRKWVSISEYDPLTNAKVWEYTATPKESLEADGLGSAQRLPNGNTLVCVSPPSKGIVFEVTPEKEIVWLYAFPEKFPENQYTWSFYRAERINLDFAKKIIPGFKH